MKRKHSIFSILIIIVCISCSSRKEVLFNATMNRLPETLYVSLEGNPHVFIKSKQDSVFVDFVLWEKYPRQLLSDTLYFDDNTYSYLGRFSTICSINGKLCVYVYKYHTNSLQYLPQKIYVKENVVDYNKNIHEKNYAIWREFAIEYQEKTGDSLLVHFHKVSQQRDIKNKLDSYSFAEFVKEIEKCRIILFDQL